MGATTERLDAKTLVVTIEGELDIANAHQFERMLSLALETAVSAVILDLGRCGFLDTSALRVIERHHRCEPGHARLVIAVPPGNPTRDVFVITKLDQLLEIYPSRTAAANAARNGSLAPSV